MTEFLTTGVRALEKAGAGFGDVRVEDRTAFVVRIANERIQAANQVRRRGWGVRAFVDGAWGYASGTSSDASAVVEAAKKATAIARGNTASGVPKSRLRKLPATQKTLTPKPKADPRDVSGEEKIAAAMEVCRAQRRDGVSSTNSQYADTDLRFQVANTWGARLSWREVRVRIPGQAVAGEGDRREAAYEFRDGTVGFELVKAMDLGEFGRRVATEAVEMLAAGKPPAGLMTVVSGRPRRYRKRT